MTSPRYNALKARAEAEMRIVDALPSRLRALVNDSPNSVRPSVIRDALLRGVSEERIIEVLTKRRGDDASHNSGD